jgi:hypothetical protein
MRILWKEWRLQRWLLFWFIILGLAFSFGELAVSRESPHGRQVHSGAIIVFSLGAFYAMLLALRSTAGDFGRTVEFWQSKPVSFLRLLTTKYVLGAGVLLVLFAITLSLDFIFSGSNDDGQRRFPWIAWQAFCYTYPIALLTFSLGMFLVIMLQDVVKAAMICIWIVLMLYFLPFLNPLLEWMNIFEQLRHKHSASPILDYYRANQSGNPLPLLNTLYYSWFDKDYAIFWQYVIYVATLISSSVILVVFSLKAAGNKWRWQPGQKTLTWTIGLTAAFLFGVGLFQVGSNLAAAKHVSGFPVGGKITFSDNDCTYYHDWADATGVPIGKYAYRWHDQTSARFAATESCLLQARIETLGHEGDPEGYHVPMEKRITQGLFDLNYLDADNALSRTLVRFLVTDPVDLLTLRIHGFFLVDEYGYILTQMRIPAEVAEAKEKFSRKTHLLIVNISDPTNPQRVNEIEIDDNDCFVEAVVYGKFMYLNRGHLAVYSLADPENPREIRTLENLGPVVPLSDQRIVPIYMKVCEDKLLCYQKNRLIIFDLAQPELPRAIAYKHFDQEDKEFRGIGFSAITYSNGYLYTASKSNLNVYRLIDNSSESATLELVGGRHATPLERLVGRWPRELTIRNELLIEAAGDFGILVYDISQPERPRRKYHVSGNFALLGFWQNTLFALNPSELYQVSLYAGSWN